MNNKQQTSNINRFANKKESQVNYLDLFYGANSRLGDYQKYIQAGNRAWYSGDSAIIGAFFKRRLGTIGGFNPMQNGFWKEVKGSVSLVHCPLLSTITETMSSILFGRMPEIKADTTNKTKNKKIDEKMSKVFDYNNLSKSLMVASQIESYSGTCAGKITIHEDLDHPVVEWYPAEFVEEHSRFGRVVEVVFKENIQEDDKDYRLKTIAGLGYIRYELWLGDEVVPINSIAQTRGLKDMFFVTEDGQPLDMLMAIWKPNRVANNIFDNNFGDSDYTGLWKIQDSLDETISTMVDIIKKSRIYTFIPNRLLAKNELGQVLDTNQAYGVDVWDVSKISEENEKIPKRDYFAISVAPYIEMARWCIQTACNRVGLSPSTLGMDDAGANASGEALNIRDQRTERTFKDKSQLWKPEIEHLAKLLMICDVYQNGTLEHNDSKIIIPNEIANTNFVVTFPEFREISPQDKFKKWIDMLDNSAMSIEYAMDDALKGAIPDADIENIKMQLGIGQEEPIEPIEDKKEEEPIEED